MILGACCGSMATFLVILEGLGVILGGLGVPLGGLLIFMPTYCGSMATFLVILGGLSVILDGLGVPLGGFWKPLEFIWELLGGLWLFFAVFISET